MTSPKLRASEVRASTSTVVQAPAEIVWNLVSDVTRIGEWSPETEAAEWVSGAPGEVGARFRGRNRRGRSAWSTTCEVVESVPGRTFAFAVGKLARPSARWRYELEEVGGTTRVTESFVLPKPLGLLSRLTTRMFLGVRDREADLLEGMQQTLQRLKAAAEQAGATQPP